MKALMCSIFALAVVVLSPLAQAQSAYPDELHRFTILPLPPNVQIFPDTYACESIGEVRTACQAMIDAAFDEALTSFSVYGPRENDDGWDEINDDWKDVYMQVQEDLGAYYADWVHVGANPCSGLQFSPPITLPSRFNLADCNNGTFYMSPADWAIYGGNYWNTPVSGVPFNPTIIPNVATPKEDFITKVRLFPYGNGFIYIIDYTTLSAVPQLYNNYFTSLDASQDTMRLQFFVDFYDDINDWTARINTRYNVTFNGRECLADWDEANGIDGDDAIAYAADWDNNVAAADIDTDGDVDGDDMTIWYNLWDNSRCH